MHVNYDDLAKSITALTEGEDDQVALMATVACEVHHAELHSQSFVQYGLLDTCRLETSGCLQRLQTERCL